MSLDPIRSDLLGDVPHGFFTRQGGVSTGIYHSLNTGSGSKDIPENVAANRARVMAHLGARALLGVYQIHSAKTVTVTRPWPDDAKPQADAMVTAQAGIALGVLSADCAPVLLADPQAGVIGAAHAGWKGAQGGILESVVDAMVALGARQGRIVAAIGPTISQRAYEVGPEFVETFIDEDRASSRYFSAGRGDRAMFDLPGFCLGRLRRLGLADAGWTGHCTHSAPERFFSYRRTCQAGETDYGRMIAAIMLKA